MWSCACTISQSKWRAKASRVGLGLVLVFIFTDLSYSLNVGKLEAKRFEANVNEHVFAAITWLRAHKLTTTLTCSDLTQCSYLFFVYCQLSADSTTRT